MNLDLVNLKYGVSVTDVNKDNKFDFVVTGFGFKNLALSYKNGKLVNIINEEIYIFRSKQKNNWCCSV